MKTPDIDAAVRGLARADREITDAAWSELSANITSEPHQRVVNLAGRSVSCRYTDTNLRQMMDSRVDSARVIGSAIQAASRPPGTWLQMSTATIYADRSDEPGNPANDEATGVIGGEESHPPLYWEYSVRIARHW